MNRKNFVQKPGNLQLHSSSTKNLSRNYRSTKLAQEDVFAKEPVRRMMSINEAYLGTNGTNPFHYQKFRLNGIIVYRNGLPLAGTPISTSNNKRIYYKTLEALDFVLESVSLIMIIIILWLLISRPLTNTISFILN